MSKSKSSGRGGTDRVELIPFRPEHSWPVQLLLAFWRWSVELLLVVLFVVLVVKVYDRSGWPVHVCVLMVAGFLLWLSGVFYLVPATRGMVPGLFWCLVTRHRLRVFFIEARVINRSAHLPWILFVRPTPVGERAFVWLVPGLSVDDFTASTERLTAATWARSVRVERSRNVATLLRVDVVRRDPLMAVDHLPSVLIPVVREKTETPAVTGPLLVPRQHIDLTVNSQGGPVGGKKNGVNTVLTAKGGKARLSSQDGPTISSAPAVRAHGGEDVSDYV